MAAGRAGDLATARRATAWAEERFAARGDLDGRAGAARSAWRCGNYHAAEGSPAEALVTGRRAVEGFSAVAEASGDPVLRRELVRACADVSVFAVMAGQQDEAIALALRGVETAQAAIAKGLDMSRDLRTELGTALHNLAAAFGARAAVRAGGPSSAEGSLADLQAGLRAADEEVRLRRSLAESGAGPGPGLAAWELASGLSQRGRLRAAAGERQSARYDLREAMDRASKLGPAGQGIVREVAVVLDRLGPA